MIRYHRKSAGVIKVSCRRQPRGYVVELRSLVPQYVIPNHYYARVQFDWETVYQPVTIDGRKCRFNYHSFDAAVEALVTHHDLQPLKVEPNVEAILELAKDGV